MAYKQTYVIYKCTNVLNGKCYVGFTNNLSTRMTAHKKLVGKSNRKLYAAMFTDGWDSFEWSILYQSWDRQHCLDVMEPHFIAEHSAWTDGYNMTVGGGRPIGAVGKSKTEDHKRKLSVALKGKKQTAETCAKKSKAFKGRVQSHEWINKRVSSRVGKVLVVDIRGNTQSVPVDFYYNQLQGSSSDLIMVRSKEGQRRMGKI
jgi:group I intron endonuclease